MALITDQSNLFNFIGSIAFTGQYSGSWGSQDLAGSFSEPGTPYAPTTAPLSFNTHTEPRLTHGFNTYFKMQGFNPVTNSYEVWFSKTSALLIPPSGNNLLDIEVVLTWIDR